MPVLARAARLSVLFAIVASLLAGPASAGAAPLPATPQAPLAADPAPPQFLRDLPDLRGLIAPTDVWVIGGGFLYWANCPGADSSGGYLRRWPVSGGRAVTVVNSRFCADPATWAADASGLYYGDGASILRRPTADPFRVETIAASAAPSGRIILDNGTTIWRDYIFWVANNTLRGVHRFTLRQFATPEPLGANAHSLIFADDNHFYWFADGVLYRALKPCLAFGGGACSRQVVVGESGDFVTDATLQFAGTTTFPLWTSGAAIRGIWCRFNTTGLVCSPSTSYTSPAFRGALGNLSSDGEFLFWIENGQTCGGLFCSFTDNGRLMKWRLSQSFGLPNDFDTPQPIACKQCFANYTIAGLPGSVAVVDGWVYFTTSNGISRLRADAPPITANLAVDSLEVTQGIQNLNNDVPLVAGKPTFVRLYGRKLSGPSTHSVAALLYGTTAQGAPLPGSPLRPLNGGQDFTANNVDPNRLVTLGSWLFQLPESWTGDRTIQLRPVIDPEQIWSDPDQSNNSFPARPFTFAARAPICLVTIPVRTHAPAASNSDPSLYRMGAITRQLLPTSDVWYYRQDNDVAQLEARFGIPPWKYEPYAVPERKDEILRALWLRDALTDDPDACDDAGAVTHYVGLVNAATNTKGNLGYGATPGANLYVKLIDGNTLNTTAQFWQAPPFNTLVHELAHNYGRTHVNCGGPARPDMNYPYRDANGTNCVLDDGLRGGAAIPAHQRYYGFDVESQTPIDPGAHADFMSYRAPFWVSDYTWRGMFSRINTPNAVGTLVQQEQGAAAQTRAELAAADQVVYLSGSVDPAANSGSLGHAWVYPADTLSPGIREKLLRDAAPRAAEAALATDAYTLRLRDAAGALLDERAITLLNAEDADGTTQAFVLTFPAPAAPVARLELTHNGAVLATLEPGGAMPTVSVLSPTGGAQIDDRMTLSWRASDPDAADRLLFSVQYSPDNGVRWYTVLTGLPSRSTDDTVTLDLRSLSGLPGSTAGGLLRVAASDGYNTALALSQTITVAPRAPQPYIDTPGAASIPAGQTVSVSGGATDVQDGGLSGAALSWTLNGRNIGVGGQQSLAGLAPGSYTLGLTASNAGGKTATVTRTLTIAPLVIPQGAAPQLDGTCDDDAYVTAPQLPLAPYPDGAQAFVRLVGSGDALYACFVGMRRTGGSSPGTLSAVRVDGNHSRDALPQPGDRLFVIGEDGVIATYDGNGGGYSAAVGGVSGQVSANATSWMAELRIEGSTFGGWGRVVGLDVEQAWVAASGDDYFWPFTARWNRPDTWATTVLGAVPQLSALTPASVVVGSGDTTVTIVGSGFAAGTVARLDEVTLATTVISTTQLQATLPATSLGVAAELGVTVVGPGLESAPAQGLPFSVTNPVPQITQATLTGTTLSITGGSFVLGATVQWNGIDYPTTGDSTRLQATVNPTAVDTGGSSVSVWNPGPGGGVSNVVLLGGNPTLDGNRVYLPLVRRS